jgi:hypothetical protein
MAAAWPGPGKVQLAGQTQFCRQSPRTHPVRFPPSSHPSGLRPKSGWLMLYPPHDECVTQAEYRRLCHGSFFGGATHDDLYLAREESILLYQDLAAKPVEPFGLSSRRDDLYLN